MRYVLLICASLLIISCKKDGEIDPRDLAASSGEKVEWWELRTEHSHYEVNNGKWPALNQGDAQKLLDWIEKKHGWSVDLITYAPWLVFRSKSLDLNVAPGSAVLNYLGKDNQWRQVSTNLDPSDTAFLHSLAKNGYQR
ncbi:MAG TPA: hypothetical protein VNW30_12685 [Opitutaceae bacterium]|jgi:hypothetical protein|nr:hypothetical protein [Opitutaceae bacterium]